MKTTTLTLGMSAMILSACANPIVAEPVKPTDYNLNCAQLSEEIRQADKLRIDSRAEDAPDPKYLFVVNGFVSAYRINKAEEAAEKRLTDLKRIAADKQCPATTLNQPLPPAGAPIVDANRQPLVSTHAPAQPVTTHSGPSQQQAAPKTSTTRTVPIAKPSYD